MQGQLLTPMGMHTEGRITMTDTMVREQNRKTLKKRMIEHCMVMNKKLPRKFLNGKTEEQLLAWCHPHDRADFYKELYPAY